MEFYNYTDADVLCDFIFYFFEYHEYLNSVYFCNSMYMSIIFVLLLKYK